MLFVANIFAQYSSVLAEGNWFKISTDKSGVYKISYSSLEGLGV